MPRNRRRRANWYYRFTLLAMCLAVVGFVAAQTLVRGFANSRPGGGIDWQLPLVSSLLDATIGVWFAAVGASIGSFLNVVAYRLPLKRNVGGHSACPYCTSAIAGSDNVPVLAWIKLRGRCRTCRLPISAQYPLVEFAVAVLFLIVYFSEFSTSAANLPGARNLFANQGFLRTSVSWQFVSRIATYLFVLSGLFAAALIAVKRRTVPFSLYAWSLAPLTIAALIRPDILIVRWRAAEPVGPLESRLDVVTTLICGLVAGVAMARVLAPLVYRNFDRSLMSADRDSVGARQFLGALAVAGAIVGWQSVVPLAWCTVLLAIVASLAVRRFATSATGHTPIETGDLTVWVWLGLLVFRANWSSISGLSTLIPSGIAPVVAFVAGALLLAPLAIVFQRLNSKSEPNAGRALDDMEEEDEHEPEPEPSNRADDQLD